MTTVTLGQRFSELTVEQLLGGDDVLVRCNCGNPMLARSYNLVRNCTTSCGRCNWKIESRFWAQVDKSGGAEACWPWIGAIGTDGYGFFCRGGRGREVASKLAWELHNKSMAGGMDVAHQCNNPPCCNPAHLKLETHKTNMAYAAKAGRMASGAAHGSRLVPESRPRGDDHWMRLRPEQVRRGEDHSMAKLSWDIVREIRRAYGAGEISQPEIARRYALNQAHVSAIVCNKNWVEEGGNARAKRIALEQARDDKIRAELTAGLTAKSAICQKYGVTRGVLDRLLGRIRPQSTAPKSQAVMRTNEERIAMAAAVLAELDRGESTQRDVARKLGVTETWVSKLARQRKLVG